ncbi:leucine-rich repeat receptor-like protein kinase PXC1 [Cynara cardunculus var. scolymus]|uniref:Leucine-rich repeat-containing protein n=1 Tax=Cynara cardunculus var. scolymus TaxID=59895 RepID=A0A103XZU7_CYNCS|nr:leucine-rich repeat receptor-like protein kinase PXC1 [Cynara cardunculus var. scolymus]KVH99913.1 Leucine-rich repeat-containing protein [Cynara cardunculus var. scolymus]
MEIFRFLLLLLLLPLSLSTAADVDSDTAALSLFRSQTDTHGILLSNWTLSSITHSTACSVAWTGVQCTNNRVTAVFLPSLDLRGPLDSLSSLDQLRILDLRHNRLNGSLLPLANCTNLKLLYLPGNDLSGSIPTELSSLTRLLRVDLSDNNLRGPIPDGISNLTRLLTLRLENNEISGEIPQSLSSLSQIKQLNLSNNELYGHLPENIAQKFGDESFSGNKGLCGSSPLPACSAATPPPTVESNPSSLPTTTIIDETKKPTHKGLHPGVIVAIVIANSVMLLVIASFLIAYYCGKRSTSSNSKLGSEIGKSRSSYGSESRVYANNGGGGGDSDGNNKLVFFDKKKKFELEDLLRASAEMLGKGGLGTVYRAVLDDGCTVVAVKRLKDANPCGRKEFEQYMDVIGKLKHPNVVKLRAYYYAKEEKLLVYDYLPNGSLHLLLHGNRGPGRIPLDWTTRISLVLGAARGLARIHEQYKASRIPHGNVKSSNVLLDKNGVACISDFGLSLLLNPAHATARLGGYKAPEQFETKRLSQKADVYSFGILLLEMLTGRAPSQYPSPSRVGVEEEEQAVDLPKWVRSVVRDEWTAEVFDQELLRYKNIEEELVSMLHVAMTCVAAHPDKRPTMAEVVKMIEEMRVEQSPLGEDYDESRNSLSPSVATTED